MARARRKGTGSGDTPATVPASAVDAPPARLALGLGGGDVYFAHPESGAPTFSPSSARTRLRLRLRGIRRRRSIRVGRGANGANRAGSTSTPRASIRKGFDRNGSPSVWGASAQAFRPPCSRFLRTSSASSRRRRSQEAGAAAVFGADFFNREADGGSGAFEARGAPAALRSASSSPLEESSRPGAAQFHASRHSLRRPRRPRRRRRQPVGRGDGSRGERVGTRYWGSQEPAVELHVGAGRVTRPARRKPRENPARADSAFDASPPDLPPLTTNQYRGGGRREAS